MTIHDDIETAKRLIAKHGGVAKIWLPADVENELREIFEIQEDKIEDLTDEVINHGWWERLADPTDQDWELIDQAIAEVLHEN